ncbi:LamG-like jellyroll fold domain-containing protein [Anaerobaca lacustris]|uniref:Discoidin domain-containing protein n=1 Tax=Anaerobaca lacustris TaxID=3044600 RepID=A0AAW6U0Z3_9BACT|nr:discoidin domain-containing protein [Sedimentisphaerales bacterium M17dextr]
MFRRPKQHVAAVFLFAVCSLLPAMPVSGQNFALDFNNNRVDIPYIGAGVDFSEISLEAYVYWRGHINTDAAGLIEGRGSTLHWQINQNNNVRIRFEGVDQNANADVQQDEWFHLAVTYNRATGELRLYKNGEVFHSFSGDSGTNSYWTSGSAQIGNSLMSGDRHWNGLIDEFRVWNRARTEAEIREAMNVELLGDEQGLIAYWKFNEGEGTTAFDSSPNEHHGTIVGATWTTAAAPVMPAGFAYAPVPANRATDVPLDAVLRWTSARDVVSHDVYFGTDFAEVEAADAGNPMGVLVSQRQSGNTFDLPGLLAFGQIYYWRVDSFEADGVTMYKGNVWSFTAEPLAYAVENIVATASAADAGAGPENTVNGSGLDADDLHSVEAADMWLATSDGVSPIWIQYEFDRIYKLYELWVWNYNVQFEPVLGFGVKDVTVEYSQDGEEWVTLGDYEFARATARTGYAHNTTVDLEGIAARYVRFTVNDNWGMLSQYGLSEVRFLYIPAQTREPQPADGATDVDPATSLNWRAGRDAASHEVYFGTDQEDLPLVGSVSEAAFAPDALNFGTTYYWRVDAVGDDVWAGELWSFATAEYALIDGFETYTDDIEAGEAIFDTWLDGWVNNTGSTVGYFDAPFAEKTIVYSGAQSMPLLYDNSTSPFYSEAERTFDSPRNWTLNGADTLRLFVAGRAPAFLESADGTILMNAIGNDIWNNADQFRYVYKNLSGNGSITARIDTLDVSPDIWVKGGVMIRQNADAGAVNVFMAMTGSGGGGSTFQQRMIATGVSVSQHTYADGPFTAPYWVRVTREGNTLTGYTSPDGENWTQRGDTITLAMTDPVLIGLALTSHNANQATSAQFSNVAFTGNVTGAWQVAEVGIAQPQGNAVAPLYVALEDATGRSAVVTHPDANIVGRSGWNEWQISLSEFAGVNLSRVDTMVIGVGSRTTPTAGGTGTIYIDDISFGKPAIAE